MVVIAFWESESSYFFALLLTAEICPYFAFEKSHPYIYTLKRLKSILARSRLVRTAFDEHT